MSKKINLYLKYWSSLPLMWSTHERNESCIHMDDVKPLSAFTMLKYVSVSTWKPSDDVTRTVSVQMTIWLLIQQRSVALVDLLLHLTWRHVNRHNFSHWHHLEVIFNQTCRINNVCQNTRLAVYLSQRVTGYYQPKHLRAPSHVYILLFINSLFT